MPLCSSSKLLAMLKDLATETHSNMLQFEPEVRAAISNTNYDCLKNIVEKSQALIDELKESPNERPLD